MVPSVGAPCSAVMSPPAWLGAVAPGLSNSIKVQCHPAAVAEWRTCLELLVLASFSAQSQPSAELAWLHNYRLAEDHQAGQDVSWHLKLQDRMWWGTSILCCTRMHALARFWLTVILMVCTCSIAGLHTERVYDIREQDEPVGLGQMPLVRHPSSCGAS